MRILAIRGKRLASLHEEFEVDFRKPPLAGAGLFAIVGATGAGKSTLLDAACLALYGDTPRMHGNGGVQVGLEADEERIASRDPRSLLTRGCRSGFAEIDFRAQDGQDYRARWWVSERARARTLGEAQMALIRLVDEQVIAKGLAATRKAIQELIGFTFDEFQKAVLLPQGQFAEFLNTDAGKRAEILEKVAGGRIYSRIGELAVRRRQAAESELHAVEAEAGALRPLEPAARAARQAGALAAAEEVERLEARVAEAAAAVTWHARRGALAAEAAQAQAELGAAIAAAAAAAPLRAEVEAVERALAEALVLAAAAQANTAVRNAEARHKQAAAMVVACTTEAGAAGVAKKSAVRVVEGVADEQRRTRPELEEARRLDDRLGEARRLAAERAGAAEAAARDAEQTAREAERLEADSGARARAGDEAKRWLAQHAAEAPVVAEWPRWKDLIERHAAATRDAVSVRRRLADAPAPETVAAARREVGEAKEQASRARADAKAAEARHAGAVAAEREAKVRADEAALALQRTRERQSLASRRAELREGDPCPLCGATSHPWAKEGELEGVVRDAEARAGETARSLRASEVHRQEADQERSALLARAARLDGAAEKGATELQRLEQALVQANRDQAESELRRCAGVQDSCEVALASAFAGVSDWRDALRTSPTQLAAAWDRQHREHGSWRQTLDAAAEALAALAPRLEAARAIAGEKRAAAEKARSAAAAAAAETRALAAARAALLGGRAVGEVEEQLASREAAAACALQGCAKVAEATAQALAEAEGKRAAAAAAAEEAQRRAGEAATALQAALRRLGVDRPLLEARVAKGQHFVTAQRAALARLDEDAAEKKGHAAARRQALALHEESHPPVLDAVAAQAVRNEAAAQLGAARERHNDAVRALKNDDDARARLAELRPRLEAALRGSQVWKQLHELVGQGGQSSYRTFVQGLALEGLVGQANRHLEQLAPRYQLMRVPGSDMDLQVLDHDQAEAVRALNSLSGGETFLVSLALALGLSALSSRAARVESLFVDEGFGTLDPETLDQAMGVLEGLQAGGRTVGVISHVPEMHERIGVLVRVDKAGAGRSRVRVERFDAAAPTA